MTFGYGAETVLKNAQLVIEPDCITDIACCSGAGKTSMLRLLNRLYDPVEGTVLIDGVDVREFTLASLRSTLRDGANRRHPSGAADFRFGSGWGPRRAARD